MAEPVHAVIVDDDQKEGGALADLLNRSGGDDLQLMMMPPKLQVEETVAAAFEALPDEGPRLLLLDYRLEDNPVDDGEHVGFRGGTIAGFVRDKEPDLPIALLTSEEKLHDWVERRAGIKEVFDWTLIKKNITERGGAEQASAQIVDYARSWQRATGWEDVPAMIWKHMEELLQAPAEEIALFRDLEGEPPRGDVPGEIIHWVLYRALQIPGPLIDRAATRVTLGLDLKSFETSEVAEWLEEAAYRGALSAFHDRWWGQLVREKLTQTAGGTRPLDASARVNALSEALGVELDHEGCRWCGSERTLQACGLCHYATDAAHSVRPLSKPLPAWADAWVICYRCIAEGRADEVLFPQSVESVVKALAEGHISQQGE